MIPVCEPKLRGICGHKVITLALMCWMFVVVTEFTRGYVEDVDVIHPSKDWTYSENLSFEVLVNA